MPPTHVQVLVAGTGVPAWHAACIERLRAVKGIVVSVVAGAQPYRAPGGPGRRLFGPALAAVAVTPAAGNGLPDIVLDLAGGSPPAAVEVWRFRLGSGAESEPPFAREIGRGAEALDVALVRHAGESGAVLRSGRFPVTRWYPSTLRWALFSAAAWPAILVAALIDGARLDAPP
ncbi:MAG: hypothetical protein JWM87_4759, partial [Candidatus Eremiobacteraeota bacterium]|nr:hypothetical protein [Candidatus Eremiobacteraeota bacterium]